ncbi:VanZ family protein [Methylobacterium sp. CM6247]
MTLKFVLTALRMLRIAGWLCIGVLIMLSWIPRELEARTGLPGQIEHAIAYCSAAAIFAFAYQDAHRWRLIAAFVALAGVLETGQLWVPGRTSQIIDFAASSAGAIAGVLLGRTAIIWLIGFILRPRRRDLNHR